MSVKAIASNPHGEELFEAIFVGASQKVAIGATSTPSTATGTKTTCVRLVSDVDCFIQIGPAPTAVGSGASCFLPAKTPQLFGCKPGDKVATIQLSTAGNLYITEGS